MPSDRSNKLGFFIIGVVLVFAAAMLQNAELISLYGVKVNLVLILLLTLVFFTANPWHYLVWALEGVLFLKVLPGVDLQTTVLLIIFFLAFYFHKYLAWQPIINNAVLIFFATILLYMIVDFSFLTHSAPIVILEAVYNVFGGLVLYLIFESLAVSSQR